MYRICIDTATHLLNSQVSSLLSIVLYSKNLQTINKLSLIVSSHKKEGTFSYVTMLVSQHKTNRYDLPVWNVKQYNIKACITMTSAINAVVCGSMWPLFFTMFVPMEQIHSVYDLQVMSIKPGDDTPLFSPSGWFIHTFKECVMSDFYILEELLVLWM